MFKRKPICLTTLALCVFFFSSIWVTPAVADTTAEKAIAKAEAAIEKIIAVPAADRDFDNTIGAIDDLMVHLRLDNDMTQFMAYVSPDPDSRQRGSEAEELIQNWLIAVAQREDLYSAVKGYADTSPQLEGEQARLLQRTLRDYRRSGMQLEKSQREKLKELKVEINKLTMDFEKNLREDETRVPLTKKELTGMPQSFFESQPVSQGLYLVGMDYPSFLPVMDYCENEMTRQKVWTSFKRRGGERNVGILEQILKLRAESAQLMGYQNAADYEIEVRMAKDSKTVLGFYEKLKPLVRKKAEKDFEEYTQAKRDHTGVATAKLYPWDQSFYEQRLLKEKYAVDSEVVRQYFPMDRVTKGLFDITQTLYGITYRNVTEEAAKRGFSIWHEDVELYEVLDNQSGELLGQFFLDLHPRANKYGHAAQFGLHPRKKWSDGSVQKPVVTLVCNFTKPTAGKPSLMTHDEVETYFHEFGHCLHSILTEADYAEFAGTSVARDFVEAPSQMFEHWVWNERVLKRFAKHYQTGEDLPAELLQGMIAAKNLGSGMKAEHQMYYGLVDLSYHMQPGGVVDTTQMGLDLYDKTELYDAVPGTYFQASFGHLMGYRAGYYGYLWSLVYAEDMFKRFEELGMLSPDAGMYYRKKILAKGGTEDAMDIVKDYLGREPKMEPFLEGLGLQ